MSSSSLSSSPRRCRCSGKDIKAKRLRVCKDAVFHGRVYFENNVTITVPSHHYPTIQSALDHFSGRNAQTGTIYIKPGKYVESLNATSFNSSASNFRIIGDARKFPGTTYLQNGNNSNSENVPGMGVDQSPVALVSGPNTVQVALLAGAIDFNAMGVVAGDAIKLRDNAGVWSDHLVTATPAPGSNTLSYDGASVAIGGYNSALVMCPNVQVVAKKPTVPVFNLQGSIGLQMQGVWLSDAPAPSPPQQEGILLLSGGVNLCATNCLVDDSAFNLAPTFSAVRVLLGSTLTSYRNYPDVIIDEVNAQPTSLTVIGGNQAGVWAYGACNVHLGSYNSFDVNNEVGYGLYADNNSGVSIFDVFQVVNSNVAFGLGGSSFCDNLHHCQVNFFEFVYAGVLFLTQCGAWFGAINFDSSSDGGMTPNDAVGIYLTRGSEMTATMPYNTIRNCTVGVLLDTATFIVLGGPIVYENIDFIGAVGSVGSTWNGVADPTTPYNTFYYEGLSATMESVYENQVIDYAGVGTANVFLGIDQGWDNVLAYAGKTYTVSASQNADIYGPYTLTLTDGATFAGFGVTPGKTVATFTGAYSNMTFNVQQGLVLVTSSSGVTFA